MGIPLKPVISCGPRRGVLLIAIANRAMSQGTALLLWMPYQIYPISTTSMPGNTELL